MTNARAVHCRRHERHIGTCPACQRARLEAEKRQLAEVQEIALAPEPQPSAHVARNGDQPFRKTSLPTAFATR